MIRSERTESRAADHDRGTVEQLHFVGFTNDNEALMLSRRDDATSGEYFVAIDEYLLAAIEQFDGEGEEAEVARQDARASSLALPRRSLPAPAPMYPKPSSELSPREIQSRLRSGSSISDVADEAGVDEEWIIRFAAPIIAEQARVVEQAQRLTFTKPRVGPSAQPLRTSVRWNLADQGALRDDEVFDAGWSAYNLQGARWVVRLSFVAKRRRKMAEWEVDLRDGELTARNRVATDLGYVAPGRKRKRDAELSAPAPVSRAKRAGAKKATKATKATKKKAAPTRVASTAVKVATKSPVSKVVQPTSRKATSKKMSPRKVAPRKVTPKKAMARKAMARKATARKATTKKATARKAPSKRPPAPVTASGRSSSPGSRPFPTITSDGVVDTPVAPAAPERLSPISGPAVVAAQPQPSPPQARAPEATPAAEAEPVPPRPPLVIMSTPDVAAGAPLTEQDLADEDSRWPLPRRRR
ncbi:MAG: septation protein SepH [Actinomycetota bacterium]|nr:septation protein SepH [Actinomycetota bacterium]